VQALRLNDFMGGTFHTPQKSELTYTVELARVLDSLIRAAGTTRERRDRDSLETDEDELAFDRSLKRGNEAIIEMLRRACREMAPPDDRMVAEFLEALEYQEIPVTELPHFRAKRHKKS
jgi:hypothetical protein